MLGRGLGAASLVGMGDPALSQGRKTRSRVEFVLAEFDRSLALQARIVDWRAGAAWAALAGGLALVSSLALETPLWWLGVVAVTAAAVAFWAWRRRVISAAGDELVRQAQAPEPDVDWDRTGMETLPHYFLAPADMTSAAQVEAVLKLSQEDLRDQARRSRGTIVAIVGQAIFAAAGLVLIFIGLLRLVLDPVLSASTLELIPPVLTGAALVIAFAESLAVVRIGRRVSGMIVVALRPELDRIWRTTEPFTTGSVLIYTDSGYLIYEPAMTVPPTEPRNKSFQRAITWVMILVAVALVSGLVAFATFFSTL